MRRKLINQQRTIEKEGGGLVLRTKVRIARIPRRTRPEVKREAWKQQLSYS